MNGLDLFSGIGGITKALEGYVRPVAYCENDRHAQAILLSRMRDGQLPRAPIWDDIRTFRGSMVPHTDIIYGGFPCQDISCAGRGAGLEGERSGLFFEIIRLVREIGPRFVFLENVPAITTRGGVRVTAELAALRYDCRWGVLSAADVGANHLRERWWLLAYTQHGHESQRPWTARREDRQRETKRGELGSNGSIRDVAYSNDLRESQQTEIRNETRERIIFVGEDVAYAPESQLHQAGRRHRSARRQARGSGAGSWWSTEPNLGRVAHGVPFRVDRLRGLGNAVVPAQAREAFERLMGIKGKIAS